MKKSELIAALEKIPGDPEVAVYDWRTNIRYDYGEGSGVGIYTDFNINFLQGEDIPNDSEPWIALSFENSELDDDGEESDPFSLVPRKCRVCGCTDYDCRQCIAKTGKPCTWIETDLCSACAETK